MLLKRLHTSKTLVYEQSLVRGSDMSKIYPASKRPHSFSYVWIRGVCSKCEVWSNISLEKIQMETWDFLHCWGLWIKGQHHENPATRNIEKMGKPGKPRGAVVKASMWNQSKDTRRLPQHLDCLSQEPGCPWRSANSSAEPRSLAF